MPLSLSNVFDTGRATATLCDWKVTSVLIESDGSLLPGLLYDEVTYEPETCRVSAQTRVQLSSMELFLILKVHRNEKKC